MKNWHAIYGYLFIHIHPKTNLIITMNVYLSSDKTATNNVTVANDTH